MRKLLERDARQELLIGGLVVVPTVAEEELRVLDDLGAGFSRQPLGPVDHRPEQALGRQAVRRHLVVEDGVHLYGSHRQVISDQFLAEGQARKAWRLDLNERTAANPFHLWRFRGSRRLRGGSCHSAVECRGTDEQSTQKGSTESHPCSPWPREASGITDD